MLRKGLLEWDLGKIAEALKLNPEDAREYFTDGRRVSVSTLFDGAMATVIDGSVACLPSSTFHLPEIAPPRRRLKGRLASLGACGAP